MMTEMLQTEEIGKLRALGDVLVPGSTRMPRFSKVSGIDSLLQVAAKSCSFPPEALASAIKGVPSLAELGAAKGFAEANPEAFELVSQVISGAYYMASEVLVALDYPLERRNPAGVSDFADEYMTGILDPVVENSRGAA